MSGGPYRELPQSKQLPKLQWQTPTFYENRINGCQCLDCPGGLGDDSRCRSPCPAGWWRRIVCRYFGHRVEGARCTRCESRLREEP